MAVKLSSQCAVAGGVELSAGNVDALTSRIKNWVCEQAQFVEQKIDGSPALKRMEQHKSAAHNIVRERLDLMTKKVDADYEFLAMQAATSRNAKEDVSSLAPVINVSGPVGVIQTGNQNLANVSQRLDEGMVEALKDVLLQMSEQLAQDDDRPDVKEAVDLAIKELSKDKPNITLLAGLITSIKQAVEFTPKLQKFADTIAPYLPMLGL